MTRSQFLGLLTLPFLTRFGVKKHPYKIDEVGCWPTKGSGPNGEVVKGDTFVKNINGVKKGDVVVDENHNIFWCIDKAGEKVRIKSIDSDNTPGEIFMVYRSRVSEKTV